MNKSKSILLIVLMLLSSIPTKVKADAVYWDASIAANGDTVTVEIVLADHRNGSLVLKADTNYLTSPEIAFKDANQYFDDVGSGETDCNTNFTNNNDGSIEIHYACQKNTVDKIEVTYKIKQRFEKTAVSIFVNDGFPKNKDIELELYKCDPCKTEECKCEQCNCESKDNTTIVDENNNATNNEKEKKEKDSNLLTYVLIGTNTVTALGLIKKTIN